MSEGTDFSALYNNSRIFNSASSSSYGSLIYGMLAVFFVIASIGLCGNATVLLIFKRTRSMRTTTNILIANLAFSDFLTLLFGIPSMVLSLVDNHPSGTSGILLCKFLTVGNIPSVSLAVSILTLTVLAFERYNAVVRPLNEKTRLTKNAVVLAICLMWITAFGFILPSFITTKYFAEKKFCYDSFNYIQGQIYHIILLVFLFFVPLCIIVYCYSKTIKELRIASGISPGNLSARQNIKEKRRIAKVLLLVSLIFSICFGAFGVVRVLEDAAITSHITYEIALLFLYSNAAFDPIIYAFQSSNYKNAFKSLINCRKRKVVSFRRSNDRRNTTELSDKKRTATLNETI